MQLNIALSLTSAAILNKGAGGVAPAGYGFLRIGSPQSNQLVRVGSNGSAPRILIKTGA